MDILVDVQKHDARTTRHVVVGTAWRSVLDDDRGGE